MARYTVHYIADENCDSLKSEVLGESDDSAEAKRLAVTHAGMSPYGAGIEDSITGEIDVGFGFGVSAPDDSEA